MKDLDLDVGSASPPTADVPTEDDWPEYVADAWNLIRREAVPYVPLFSARIAERAVRELDAAGMLQRPADHSGVAGEPIGPLITCSEPGCHSPATDRCAGPTGAGCERPYCGEHIYHAGYDGLLCSTDYNAIEHRDLDGYDEIHSSETRAEEGVAGEPEATSKGSSSAIPTDLVRALFAFWDCYHNHTGFVDVDEPGVASGIMAEDALQLDGLSDFIEPHEGFLRDALSAPGSVPPTQLPAPTPDSPGDVATAGGVVVPDETRKAAARLRRAAAARLEYAANAPADQRSVLEDEANVLQLAAQVVAGDLGPLLGWMPSWRWTDEMTRWAQEGRRG